MMAQCNSAEYFEYFPERWMADFNETVWKAPNGFYIDPPASRLAPIPNADQVSDNVHTNNDRQGEE
jgi:hypothetical protein